VRVQLIQPLLPGVVNLVFRKVFSRESERLHARKIFHILLRNADLGKGGYREKGDLFHASAPIVVDYVRYSPVLAGYLARKADRLNVEILSEGIVIPCDLVLGFGGRKPLDYFLGRELLPGGRLLLGRRHDDTEKSNYVYKTDHGLTPQLDILRYERHQRIKI